MSRAVVVVGQTPPPHGGQAVMIQRLLEGDYGDIVLHHVRLGFSRRMDGVGEFRVRKLWQLPATVTRIIVARIRHGARILYYPPGGSNILPILRDIVVLGLVRPLFARTIFHFHGSGWTERYEALPALLKPLYRHAYCSPDVAIRTSELAPEDGRRLRALREVVVPYGIPDVWPEHGRAAGDPTVPDAAPAKPPVILFVGVLRPSKGVEILLEALAKLMQRGVGFRAVLVGAFDTPAYEKQLRRWVSDHGLAGCVEFPGVLIGSEKWRRFAAADLFCLPSYFESEAFPVVLVEALSFALPVVATRWRGIPAIVLDGDNGLLVEPRRVEPVVAALARLLGDAEARRRMGAASRRRFLAEFTLDKYHARMRRVFEEALAGAGAPESSR